MVWCQPSWCPTCFICGVCIICYKISSIYWGRWGSSTLCFVSAWDIACLSVFSCAVLYACVIFVISLDILFVKFFNSSVFMLHCCRIMVDWSCGCACANCWCVAYVIVSYNQVFEVVCVLVSLGRSLWFCKIDSLAIVSKALNPGGSAGVNGTILIVLSLQIAMMWLSVILLVFILYHWWVSGVTVLHVDSFKSIWMWEQLTGLFECSNRYAWCELSYLCRPLDVMIVRLCCTVCLNVIVCQCLLLFAEHYYFVEHGHYGCKFVPGLVHFVYVCFWLCVCNFRCGM